MSNITAYAFVYNEESRIEIFLKNLSWCDDIIIYNRSSTDKTVEIASHYPCRIINVPYSDGTNLETASLVLDDATHEWLLHFTCSDIVHPKLVDEWIKLINDLNFSYDVIAFPYQVGVLGIINKRSPWASHELKEKLFKKSAVVFSEHVHKEILFKSGSKIYKMKKNNKEAVFHLTHETLDIFFERVIRYAKAEANNYRTVNQAFFKITIEIFAAIVWMLLCKKTLFLGKKGYILFLGFLIYFFCKLLFSWEKFTQNGKREYSKLRIEFIKNWEDENLK